MAKREKKYEAIDILRGHQVEVVAKKKGIIRAREMEYTEAVKAMKLFNKKGWFCLLYQVGFYQGIRNNENENGQGQAPVKKTAKK